MGAHVPRPPEAVRPVDRGPEGERRDRADARHAHQPPADLLPRATVQNLLRQPGELRQHRGQDRQQRLDDRHHSPIIAGELAHAPGEGGAARQCRA